MRARGVPPRGRESPMEWGFSGMGVEYGGARRGAAVWGRTMQDLRGGPPGETVNL